ncbi:MAG: Na/Pi cotransporter family protein [Acidobacteriota bacterium]|nr:Na/Pi cotransporter family protein [Acidobacteriota bacterium]
MRRPAWLPVGCGKLPTSGPVVLGVAAVAVVAVGAMADSGAEPAVVAAGTGDLRLGALIMGLFGGLAFFLYGMEQMSSALKAVAGDRMKTILGRLTHNRFLAAGTGAFVTAVVQSSSVTTVLVVGFISAGLMTLSQSIGVILGANIGTTITAQIIAFKVTRLALAMIAVGFALTFFGKREKTRHHGAGIMGLGLVFFGMSVMGEAMAPLRTYGPFLEWMARMENPALGIFVGTLFTALVQSSSATTGIVIVLAGQGLLSLPAGIALVFGANVGTCITALLASIGRPREALRAATVHVIFNLVGVVLWLPFIGQLAEWVKRLSPRAPELDGLARLAAETPRQIANAHTLFNTVNTLLFLVFTAQLAWLVQRLVPDRPTMIEASVRAKYLDSTLLGTPALALDRVRLEILHLGEYVAAMLDAARSALFEGTRSELEELAKMDDAVDRLHGQVITYLGKISRQELGESQTRELMELMEAANSLENIGDIVETNLVFLGLERLDQQLTVSAATRRMLEEFYDAVRRALDISVQAVTQQNRRAARPVVEMKAEINQLAAAAAEHQARRLVAEEPNRLPAYTLETDILQNLKRIYYFTKRMARNVVSEGGDELDETGGEIESRAERIASEG